MWRKKIDFLDEQYELTLLLFTIISAGVFQYFTFIIQWFYLEPSMETRKNIIYLTSAIARRLFLPIMFSIIFWFISLRCTKQKDRDWRIVFKMKAWIQLTFAMFYTLRSFILFIGNPLVTKSDSLTTIIAAIPTVFLLALILFNYWSQVKNVNLLLILLLISVNVLLLVFVEFFAIIETPVEVWNKIIGELPQ